MSWSPWVWVGIFAFIAVGGAIVLALLVRRLWRQAKALSAELERTAAQADELAQLLAAAGDSVSAAGARVAEAGAAVAAVAEPLSRRATVAS